MEIFLVIFIVWIFYVISKIRFRSSGNIFRDSINKRKRREEEEKIRTKEDRWSEVIAKKAERETEEQKINRRRDEAIKEAIEAAKRKEEEKKKETPEERKARLKKLAKERVDRLLNTNTQNLGGNQGDTSGDYIHTGPRGGRYRITDKGRKSYDLK